jgi:hypothetical protein
MKNGVFWDVTPCGSCNIQEDTILHSHRRENLKSYTAIQHPGMWIGISERNIFTFQKRRYCFVLLM